MRELNLAGNKLALQQDSTYQTDMSGIIAISDAIPTMGALESLDLRQNAIPESKASRIKALCEAKSVSLKA